MKVAVDSIAHNPFRNLKIYPTNPKKITALVQSIKDTGFWDNIVLRPNGKGYQLAYGHNRLAAVKKAKNPDGNPITHIDVPVRNLDDTTMARMMANENMQEWNHDAVIEQETVRAIVAAYGEGRVQLPQPSSKARHDQLRYAPSFLLGDETRSSGAHPYTIETLCSFLHWEKWKVEAAVNALTLIAQGIATPETFRGLSTRQAQSVTEQTNRIHHETGSLDKAREVASTLAVGFGKGSGLGEGGKKKRGGGDVTIHNARRKADDAAGTTTKTAKMKRAKKVPSFEKFVDSMMKGVAFYFSDRKARWDAVMHYKDEMDKEQKRRLAASLKNLIKEAQKYLDKLEA